MPKTRNAFAFRGFNVNKYLGIIEQVKTLDLPPNMKQKICNEATFLLHRMGTRIAIHIGRLARFGTLLKERKELVNSDLNNRVAITILAYARITQKISSATKKIEETQAELEANEKTCFLKIFSGRLTQARKEAKLTQEELAKRIGVKRSTYGQFEQGRNEPNISLLPALSRELNRPVGYFLGE